MSVSLESLVQEWLRLDKVTSFLEPNNKSTRADIQALWDEGNTEELENRMRWIAKHFPSFDVIAILHSLAERALSSVLLVRSRVVAVLRLRFADISWSRVKRENGSWMVSHEWSYYHTSFPGSLSCRFLLVLPSTFRIKRDSALMSSPMFAMLWHVESSLDTIIGTTQSDGLSWLRLFFPRNKSEFTCTEALFIPR